MKLRHLQEILSRYPGEGIELSQVRHCIYITEGSKILAVLDVETGVLTESSPPAPKGKPQNKFGVSDL